MKDDREFWLEMRRALLIIASGASDAATKRGCEQMAASIEKRFKIPRIRLIQGKQDTG